MTSVGHTLTGIAIGIMFKPKRLPRKWAVVHLTVFAFLANIPDLPFPNWGHDKYRVSHSLFVTLLLIIIFAIGLVSKQKVLRRLGGWQVIIGGALAWISHLLLDSFYNTGYGVAIFWPFSAARLALPIPWFSVLPNIAFPITWSIIQIFLLEFISYFPLVILATIYRSSLLKNTANYLAK